MTAGCPASSIIGGGAMGSSIAWHLSSRSQLHGHGHRHRARSDLCARLVGVVGELDPAAVLDAAQHPSVALRHRLPAPGAGAAGCRSRAEGAGLSVPGEPGGRGGAARQPCDPEGRGLRGRAARSGGAGAAVPGDLGRRRGARLARHGQRGLVRRAGADAGLPPQGARARRRVRRRRGRGPGAARRHPALRRARSRPRTIVIAAGPWSGEVAAMAGIALPVEPRRRSVFVFDCREQLPLLPLTIDPSGVWFRPEGRFYLAGTTPRRGQRPARRAARGPAPGMGRHGLAGAGRARAGLRGGQGGEFLGGLLRVQHLRPERHRRPPSGDREHRSSPPASPATASSSRRRSAAPSPS